MSSQYHYWPDTVLEFRRQAEEAQAAADAERAEVFASLGLEVVE